MPPKSAQRVKGGLRPASSSLAAELIQKDGSRVIGFSAFASGDSSTEELIEESFDADLALALRKISKRDTTTKVKALEELRLLVDSKPVDDLVAMLPKWIKTYSKLTLENDRRVRDGAQIVLGRVVSRVQKRIAPMLKSLMPFWLCSRFDQSRDVSRNATAAFEAAFSSGKERQALLHCQDEIITHMSDTITNQTAETLGDPKILTKDELESVYERTIAACFLSLSYFITKVFEEEETSDGVVSSSTDSARLAVISSSEKLLDSKKVWSFAKHTSPSIRRSLYRWLATLALKCPSILENRLIALNGCLLAFNEKDPSCLPELWEALLLISKAFPSLWSAKDARKAVFPQLFTFCRNGCYGSARVSYPSLLPLIGGIPTQIRDSNIQGFWESLLTAVRDGIQSDNFGGADNSVQFLDSFVELLQLFTIIDISDDANRVRVISDNFTWLTQTIVLQTAKLQGGRVTRSVVRFLEFMLHRDNLKELVQSLQAIVSETVLNAVVDVDVSQTTLSRVFLLLTALHDSPELLQSSKDLTIRSFHSAVSICLNPEASQQARLSFFAQLLNQPDLLGDLNTIVDALKPLFHIDWYQARLQKWIESNDVAILESYFLIFVALIKITNAANINNIFNDVISVTFTSSSTSAKLALVNNLQNISLEPSLCAHSAVDQFLQETFEKQLPETDNEALVKLVSYLIGSLPGRLCASEQVQSLILSKIHQGIAGANQPFFVQLLMLLAEQSSTITFLIQPSQNLLLDVALDCSLEGHEAAYHSVWLKATQTLLSSSDLRQTFISQVVESSIASLKDSSSLLESHKVLLRLNLIIKDLCVDSPQDLRNLVSTILLQLKPSLSEVPQFSSQEDEISLAFALHGVEQGVIFSPFVVDRDGVALLSKALIAPPATVLQLSKVTARAISFARDLILDHASQLFVNFVADQALIELLLAFIESIAFWKPVLPSVCTHTVDDPVQRFLLSILKPFQQTSFEFVNDALRSAPASSSLSGAQLFVVELVGLIVSRLQNARVTVFSSTIITAQLLLHSVVSVVASITDNVQSIADVLLSPQIVFDVRVVGMRALLPQLAQQQPDLLKSVTVSSLAYLQQLPAEQVFGTSGASRIEAWKRLVQLNSACENSSITSSTMNTLVDIYTASSGDHLRGRERAAQAEAARLLFKIVASLPMPFWTGETEAKRTQWDFVMDRLTTWLSQLSLSPVHCDTALLLIQSMRILQEIVALFREENEQSKDKPSPAVVSLIRDWNSRKPVLFEPLWTLFINYNELTHSPSGRYLIKIASNLVSESPESVALTRTDLPVLDKYCELLCVSNDAVQRGAFSLLRRLVQMEAQVLSLQEENRPADPDSSADVDPSVLLGATLQKLLNTVFHVRRQDIEESQRLEQAQNNDAQHYLLAYLLGWLLIVDYLEAENTRLRLSHIGYLRELDSNPLEELLLLLIELLNLHDQPYLPQQPVHRLPLNAWDAATVQLHSAFAQLAAHVFWRLLRGMPAFVRQWWSDSNDRKLKIAMESYTETHFSSAIIAHHVASVATKEKNFDNMTVKAGLASKQVTATYTIEEMSMEMCIRFPPSFPLRPADIEGGNRVGVTESQWRRWLLSMTMVIASQNGTILEALQMWKQDADKMFEGIEECAICYCVVHNTNRSLPKVACKTCKHKFHAVCLYKWFRSSSQSTCPLCRNLF